MSKKGSREHYDAEFKREAVRLLLTSGKSATQLARELGVSSWSLGRWKQDALKARDEIEGQGHSTTAVEQENRQLRRELEAMRRQRDLLKKAIAICSEDGLRQEGMGAGRVRGMK